MPLNQEYLKKRLAEEDAKKAQSKTTIEPSNSLIDKAYSLTSSALNSASFGLSGVGEDVINAGAQTVYDAFTGEDSSPGMSDYAHQRKLRTGKYRDNPYSTFVGDTAGAVIPGVAAAKFAKTGVGAVARLVDDFLFKAAPNASGAKQLGKLASSGGLTSATTSYGGGADPDEAAAVGVLGAAAVPAITAGAAITKNVAGRVLDTGILDSLFPVAAREHARNNVADALFDDLPSRGLIHRNTQKSSGAPVVTPQTVADQLGQAPPNALTGEAIQGSLGDNMMRHAGQSANITGQNIDIPEAGMDILKQRFAKASDYAAGTTAKVLGTVSPNTSAVQARAQVQARKDAIKEGYEQIKQVADEFDMKPVLDALDPTTMKRIPLEERTYLNNMRERLVGSRRVQQPLAPDGYMDTETMLSERNGIVRKIRNLHSGEGTVDAADLNLLDKLQEIKQQYDAILSDAHPGVYDKLVSDYGAALADDAHISMGMDAIEKSSFRYDNLEKIYNKATASERDALRIGATQAYINKTASSGETGTLRRLGRNEDSDIVRKIKFLFGEDAYQKLISEADKAVTEFNSVKIAQKAKGRESIPGVSAPTQTNRLLDLATLANVWGGHSTRATAARRLVNMPNPKEAQAIVDLLFSPANQAGGDLLDLATRHARGSQKLSPRLAAGAARVVGSRGGEILNK